MKTSFGIAVVAALVAGAGSANAGIVTGPGSGSNCATFEGSTLTTITYSDFTDGSWDGELFQFRIKTVLFSSGPTVMITQIPVGLIEYSYNAGGLWNVYSTSSTSANNLLISSGSAGWGPAIIPSSGLIVGPNNFLFRVTIPANPLLVNGQTFWASVEYSTAAGGGTSTRASQVVPNHGTAALLGLGGLLAARRRR
jgi:MYXO-CTERM domain-containing protein